MRRNASVLALVVTMLLVAPVVAWACSCIESGPPCQAVFRTDAIFTGRVLRIESSSLVDTVPMGNGRPDVSITRSQREITIRVGEVFRGLVRPGTDVIVKTGSGDADCGYRFSDGVEYVIYAGDRAGALSTSICTRTAPVSAAADDLTFLRALAAGVAGPSRILGTARYFDESLTTGSRLEPFAGLRVMLSADGRPMQAMTTAADGAFGADVPVGSYAISFEAPAGYYVDRLPTTVTLKDSRACEAVNVTIRDDGHVVGRVVDSAGAPVSHLAVAIARPAQGRAGPQWLGGTTARTDALGRFDIARLPAGKYLVATNAIEPAADHAVAVEVGRRAVATTDDLVLPASQHVARLTGRVVDDAGRAVEGAKVFANAAIGPFRTIGPAVVTDSDGRFEFAVREGLTYRLVAEGMTRAPGRFDRGEIASVRAEAGMASLVISLKRPQL